MPAYGKVSAWAPLAAAALAAAAFVVDRWSPIGPVLGPAVLAAAALACLSPTARAWARRALLGDRSSETVAESEARLRLITDHLPALVAYIGPDERIQFVNRPHTDRFGVPLDRLIGLDYRNFAETWLVSDAEDTTLEALMGRIRQALDGREVVFEGPRRFAGGKLSYVEGHFVPHRAADGTVLGVLSLIQDITRRHESEQALSQSERQYRQLFEVAPDAFLIQRDAQIVYANQAAARLFRRASAAELIGSDPLDFYPEHVQQTVRQRRERIMRTGLPSPPREFTIRPRADLEIEVEVVGSRVTWGGGPAVLILMRDIGERKRALEAVRAARDQAEAANRAKSDFLATVSHEIRTPMNGVIGAASALLDADLAADQRDLVGLIQRSGEALLRIINDILDVSKMEAGMLELDALPVDPVDVARSVIDLLTPASRDRRVALSLSVRPDVPQTVIGDPARLRQILLNLVGNALKFTEDGHVAVEVSRPEAAPETARDPAGTVLRFDVVDDGIGVPIDDQQAIFERFTQADNAATRRVGGTGLGLTICRELTRRMGGEIGLESAPGKGSRFWFTVRMGHAGDAAEAAPRPVPAPPPEAGATSSPERSLRLLIVDDNDVNRKVAVALLTALGHEVDIADGGEACLERLAESPFDAILMDIQMPDMDGIAVTRRIRALGHGGTRMPVIAMTANAMKGDRERYLAAGMDGYISKPIDAVQISAALAAACTREAA